jgi:putative hydrolase of the HAD superfamily
MRSLPIAAISFDGDGTLWDFDKVMRHSLRRALDELRRQVSRCRWKQLTIEEMIRIRNMVALELSGQETSLEQIRLRAFQRTLEEIGARDDDLACRLNELYLKHRFEDIELYPDVIPVLDALAGQFRIGLLSNGNTYPERCGLGGRFSFVIFSQEYGFEKPDRRIFEVALEAAGCLGYELLHVGDSLVGDVSGAQNAGVRSVWLNRARIQNDTGIEADFEITTLDEVLTICATA